MEQVQFGLYAVIVIGSLCGLRAAMHLGGLAYRIARLEQRLGVGGPPPVAADPVPVAAGPVPVTADPVPVAAGPVPVAAAPRPPAADWWHAFELRAGTRWVTWLGAGALVIAAAMFVKLAIDRGWLGPEARLVLGGAGGVGLLLAGRRAHRAEMRPLAQGLFGAGLGVLYVATYVAFASYGLIARELVFAAMIGVTITGSAIALRHDAQPVAVLALLGGLLTPLAVSSGDGSRDALLAYLLVLDLGAVAIALLRRWQALELIALAGTWALFGGWLVHAHDAAAWPAELAWLAALHAVFAVLPVGFHLRRRAATALDGGLVAAANAAVSLALAGVIVDGRLGALGAIALGMAAMYGALEALARCRSAGAGLAGLAAALATLAVGLLLRGHGATLAWSLEALLLLALGFHDRRASLRLAAAGVLALAAVNGVVLHWPVHDAGFRPVANAAFAGAMIAPLAAWLFAAVHRALRGRAGGQAGGQDHARDRWHAAAAALAGSAVALALVHGELARWFALAGRPDLGDAVVPLVWAGGALLALALVVAARRPSLPSSIAVAIVLCAGAAAWLCVVAYQWPAHPDALLALNLRFASAAVTAGALAASAVVVGRRDPALGRLAWAGAIAGVGVALGAEAYLHYAAFDQLANAPRRAHTALSLAWSGYAAVLLAIGFLRRRRQLRLAGLGLLGVVAIKLLLLDLAGAPQAYRVLSFLIVGALMIAVSYAYHRLERRGPPEA